MSAKSKAAAALVAAAALAAASEIESESNSAPADQTNEQSAGIVAQELVESGQLEQPVLTVATMVAEPVATPTQKKGKSSIPFPVAYVWILCHNAFAKAQQAGTAAPSRKSLVAQAISDGVAYYTSRTQVQAYLKATANGTRIPKTLPRNVSLTPISAPAAS